MAVRRRTLGKRRTLGNKKRMTRGRTTRGNKRQITRRRTTRGAGPGRQAPTTALDRARAAGDEAKRQVLINSGPLANMTPVQTRELHRQMDAAYSAAYTASLAAAGKLS